MTAYEWNAKHPIGTRVIVRPAYRSKNDYFVGFSVDMANEDCLVPAVYVDSNESPQLSMWALHLLEPISAYPGDMYTGQPLKKVRID